MGLRYRRSPVARVVGFVAATAVLFGGQHAVSASVHAAADVQQVGLGSFTTARVGSPPQGCAPLATDARAFLTATAPTGAVPTNTWWSSLVFKRAGNCTTSAPLYAHPVAYQPETDGLGLGYGTEPVVTGDPGGSGEFHLPYTEDLLVGVDGLDAPVVEVADWSDWTVTPSWSDGVRTMTATVGHGLPFSWYRMTGGDAILTAADGVRVWLDDGARIGFTAGSSDYVAFAPSGATWSSDGTTLRSDLAGGDHLSVALLPSTPADTDGDRLAIAAAYSPYAYTEVTDTRAEPTYDASASVVRTVHRVRTEPMEGFGAGTVISLYPHQSTHLDEVAAAGPGAGASTDRPYVSPRGDMATLVGATSFTTATPFTGVLPEVPAVATDDGEARDRLDSLLDEAAADPMNLQRGDTYWTGKALGRAARIAEVADQLGRTDVRDTALDRIEETLTDWFTADPGTDERLFAYNEDWGTLVGFPAAHGSDTELNDHHFHHGYFVVAAATLARFEPEWAAQAAFGGMVDELIADANGFDRGDTRYPYLRTFDVYAGHDWASGHGAFAAGNNQESSSEAQNLAYGMIQWGSATGDTATRDAGIYLHATQAAAIEQYWFDGSGAMPASFGHRTVGIVWGSGAAYDTWFSQRPEMIQGINVLPVTGGSLHLGVRSDEVVTRYEDLRDARGGDPTVWRDILWSYLALGDGSRALAELEADPTYVEEEGGSRAHTYHWIANLASLGTVDATTHADHPQAVAFDGPEGTTYVAANAGPATSTVTFSDGTTLEVPAGRTVASGAHEWTGGGDPADPDPPTQPPPDDGEDPTDPPTDPPTVPPTDPDGPRRDGVCERRGGAPTFPDAPGSGHQASIDCLADLGIVQGMDDGRFRPAADVTRAQLSSFIVRAIETATGRPMATGGATFPDVEPGSTHGQAIQALRAAGIIAGYTDGTFRPAEPVRRDQTARYVVNAVELVAGERLPRSGASFPDVANGSQYGSDIDALVSAGVVSGFADGTFGPRGSVTRGQMARFIGNALEELDRRGAYRGP